LERAAFYGRPTLIAKLPIRRLCIPVGCCSQIPPKGNPESWLRPATADESP